MGSATVLVCEAPFRQGPNKGKPATGTKSGWQRHYRAGEEACEACKAGVRATSKAQAEANREKQREACRRWYEKNREKHRRNGYVWKAENWGRYKEHRDAWYQANRESEIERARRYREADPDRALEIQRRHRERHPEKVRQRSREWRRKNPEAVKAMTRARRARVQQAPSVPFTAEQLAQRLSMFAGCWMCGDPDADTIDHVKPLAADGWHCLSNIRPACGPCNYSKRHTWPVRAAPV